MILVGGFGWHTTSTLCIINAGYFIKFGTFFAAAFLCSMRKAAKRKSASVSGMLSGDSKGVFVRFAEKTAIFAGCPKAFLAAFVFVAGWAVTGPLFGFSDTWQLVINTGTTIVTFLMVFLIQNTQNRDTMAMQLKLDELIRVTKGAHTALLDLEELSEEELRKIRNQYEKLAKEARKSLRSGKDDTSIPDVFNEKN